VRKRIFPVVLIAVLSASGGLLAHAEDCPWETQTDGSPNSLRAIAACEEKAALANPALAGYYRHMAEEHREAAKDAERRRQELPPTHNPDSPCYWPTLLAKETPESLRKLADCEDAEPGQHNPTHATDLRRQASKVEAAARRGTKPGASIGMTADEVIADTSWGVPDHVNRTVTADGEREQWVYPGGYLYFEGAANYHGGRLVAIQTK
jgi:hypothetical protein